MYKKLLDNIDAFKKIKKHVQLISLVHLILNQHCLLINLHTFFWNSSCWNWISNIWKTIIPIHYLNLFI